MGFGSNPADEMLSAVNSGVDVEAFKESVDSGHNALQQNLMDECLRPAIVALAETRFTDARNERAVSEAQDVCDEMGWNYEA